MAKKDHVVQSTKQCLPCSPAALAGTKCQLVDRLAGDGTSLQGSRRLCAAFWTRAKGHGEFNPQPGAHRNPCQLTLQVTSHWRNLTKHQLLLPQPQMSPHLPGFPMESLSFCCKRVRVSRYCRYTWAFAQLLIFILYDVFNLSSIVLHLFF